MKRRLRLAYLVSHPIQYQAPLLRRIAQEPDLDLLVLFGSDFSARPYKDAGFGTEVAWDVPLLEGYRYRVLPAFRDNGTVSALTPLSRGLFRALADQAGQPAFDALWVHGYASANALRAIAAAYALGIPVLLRAESWLGDHQRGGCKLLAKKLFFRGLRPGLAAVLPIGSRNAVYWQESLGSGVQQFPVPYVVDNGYFAQQAVRARDNSAILCRQWKLEQGRPIILFASKLQERKHADHLLQAVAAAQLTPAPYVLIAGEGEERQRLEQLSADLGLAAQVRFLGFQNQSQLPDLFALADVFVLPSEAEPWGLVVNEALASGCPAIVSSDVGAAPDLVREGENGFVFPTGDVGALAGALRQALETPRHATRMRQAAAAGMGFWDFEVAVRGLRAALAQTTGLVRA